MKKACKKQDKHQKLIITGDFNATTSVSLKQCFFDGSNVVEDTVCNEKVTRIKIFFFELKLCLTQSYFAHPLGKIYTWHNIEKITKKVLDYILMEPFMQQ